MAAHLLFCSHFCRLFSFLLPVSGAPLLSAAVVVPGAVTLDFDSTGHPGGGGTIDPFEEDGFVVGTFMGWTGGVEGSYMFMQNPPTGLLNNGGSNTIPYNGSPYLQPFTGSVLELRPGRSVPFQLISLDFAEYSASFQVPFRLTVTGYFSDGGQIVKTVMSDGILAGQPGDFQTLQFGPEWTGLERVTAGYYVTSDGMTNPFSIDNIVVAPVPEPGALGLVALGALSLLRRRRN